MEKKIFLKGPDPKLELAYSDVWLSGLYSRRILVFEVPPGPSQARALTTIEQAIQALVDGTPELGSLSVIVPEADHNGKTPWRALAPYEGIEFIVKDFAQSFPSFSELQQQGFPMATFKDRLLMPVPYRIEPAPQPQTKVQASVINGGLLLSICIFHHLTDGNGMNTIVRALGQACKRAANKTEALSPIVLNTDRALMNSVHGTQTDLIHHPAHRHVPNTYLPRARTLSKSIPPSKSTPLASTATILRLPSLNAIRLKVVVNGSTPDPVSTHDAITALLWRTLVLARLAAGHLAATDTAIFSFPVDARRFLGLPADWVGNCVYFCVVERQVSAFEPAADAGAGGVPSAVEVVREVAAQIHAARAQIDASRVAGIMTRRREDPFSLAWWPAGRAGDPKVLVSTSFYHSGMLDGGDWGEDLGPPVHFTTSDLGAMAGGFERTAFVGPRIKGGKGCDVVAGLDGRETEFFRDDELWNAYFEPLSRHCFST